MVKFETYLLLQSLVMIAAQLILLQLCVKLRSSSQYNLSSNSTKMLSLSAFWNWNSLEVYIQFCLTIAGIAGAGVILLGNQKWFAEIVGILALGIEACLGVPQVWQNYQKHNTKGLDYILIATWFIGDSFKTIIFVYDQAPMQFVGCGLFQLFIDCVVLIQMAVYGSH